MRVGDLQRGVFVVVGEGDDEGQGTVREDDGGAALGVLAQPQHELA